MSCNYLEFDIGPCLNLQVDNFSPSQKKDDKEVNLISAHEEGIKTTAKGELVIGMSQNVQRNVAAMGQMVTGMFVRTHESS